MTEWSKKAGLGPAWIEALDGLGEVIAPYEESADGLPLEPEVGSIKKFTS